MDWPLAGGYAAACLATLVYISHESRVPQQAAVVVSGSPVPTSQTASRGAALQQASSNTVSAANSDAWKSPDVDKRPRDVWGKAVRLGRDLTVATYAHIGPEVPDPSKRFAGSNMSCQSCHLEAGTKKFGMTFVGVFSDFPQNRSREGEVCTIEDRING